MKLPKPEDITYENMHGHKTLRGFRLTPEWALLSAPNGYRFVFLPTGAHSRDFTGEQIYNAIEHIPEPPPGDGTLTLGGPVPAEQVAWCAEAVATIERIGAERAKADGLKLYKARVTRTTFADRWVLAKNETHAADLAERSLTDDDFDIRDGDTSADAWTPTRTSISAYEGDDGCVTPAYLGHMRLPEANALVGSPLTIAEYARKEPKP